MREVFCLPILIKIGLISNLLPLPIFYGLTRIIPQSLDVRLQSIGENLYSFSLDSPPHLIVDVLGQSIEKYFEDNLGKL
jgi:hypothetical protein